MYSINSIGERFNFIGKEVHLSLPFKLKEINESLYPIQPNFSSNEVLINLTFINLLSDRVIDNLIIFTLVVWSLRSECYYDGDMILTSSPEKIVRELLDNLGIAYYSFIDLEDRIRAKRQRLYPYPHKFYSYYNKGDVIKNGLCKYEVINITPSKEDAIITFKCIYPEQTIPKVYSDNEANVFRNYYLIKKLTNSNIC